MEAIPAPVERIGRDWAQIYRVAVEAPCLACGVPTGLRVCFTPRACLALCGRCRGH